MGDSCNPLDGSRHTCELSRYITQRGINMVNTFKGGNKNIKKDRTNSRNSRKSRKSRKKRSRYSKYAYVHKKQYTHKYKHKDKHKHPNK